MAYCDMCGNPADVVFDAVVEGSMLSICEKCKAYGSVISVKVPKENKLRIQEIKPKEDFFEQIKDIIVDDYSYVIKNARESIGMKQEELAKEVRERVSVIHKLEANQMAPSLSLARRLERFLNIHLVENYTKKVKKNISFSDKSLTIGDLIKVRKKEI